ncbi:LPXTG cell wall anchor domain-containing protein [Streptomyces sp. NPDC001744]|uniref:LPXTG cell wall anchor domain-containing protein n=1 Tax=Streptomyces sp. NPDC001744 TaxID=3364606 RepID=UPI003694E4B9
MRRTLISSGALVAAVAGSLILAPVASASGQTYDLKLHQKTPITAASYEQGKCPSSIPADKDGWHFVIPGNGVNFVELTVRFDDGAPITIKDFGPPKDDHAYVASERGAKLTSAVAVVDGKVKQGFFNLSHTCAASVAPTPSDKPSETTPGTPTGTPSVTPSETTPGTPSGTPSATTPGTPTETTPGTPTGTPSGTPSATTPGTSASPTGTPGASETPGGTESPATTAPAGGNGGPGTPGEGDLAETGAGAPIGIIAAAALALAAAGAVLVTRRRKAQQH